jgi:Carboxypeptidase regulatory-like domain
MIWRHRYPIIVAAIVLAVGAAGIAQQAGSPSPPASAAVSGVVVDAVSRQPLAGAYVTLGIGSYGQATLQMTDSRGRFVFRGVVPRDTYALRANKPGYFEGFSRGSSRDASPAIALADGEWLKDVRIALTRWGSISGRVTDEYGDPLVGSFVRTIVTIPIAGRLQTAAGPLTRTDDRGIYRLGGLAEGRYIVSVPSSQDTVTSDTPVRTVTAGNVSAGMRDSPAIDLSEGRLVIGSYATPPPPEGGRPQAYPITFYPAALAVADATPITLGPAENRSGVDLQVRPVGTWTLSGHVTSPAGDGSGLTLRLMPLGLEGLGFGSEAATTVVGKGGRFTFLNVPAGRYTIDARQSVLEFRYLPAGNTPLLLPQPPALSMTIGSAGELATGPPGTLYDARAMTSPESLWAATSVEVIDRDVSDVAVRLYPGVTLSGRVVPENAVAGDRPPGGPPAFVMAEPASGSPALGMPHSSATRADPTAFTLRGLRPGAYVLRIFGGPILSITADGKDYTHTPFDAAAGHDITDIVITTTTRLGVVSGSVANFSAAAHMAVVLVFPVERDRWANGGFQEREINAIPVNTHGQYTARLPAGEYFLAAVDSEDADRRGDPAFLAAVAGRAERVSVDWGGRKTQDLRLIEVAR